MMHRKVIVCTICIILIFTASLFSRNDRQIFRVAYFEGGSYFIHKLMLLELKNFLDEMKDDSIEFIFEPYGYFTAEWNRDKCRAMADDLARMKNIDLVFTFGPWVVSDLVAAGFKKPIIGIYQFDPDVTGLVDSLGVPIVQNLTVNYQPHKIDSDLASLYKLFSPRRIGLLYFPSGEESNKYRDKVHKTASNFGAVVYMENKISRKGIYSYFLSFEEIKKNVDVLYIPPLWGMDLEQMKQFYRETQHARLPTFASEGFLQLEKGATAANCTYPYRPLAKFTADKILKIINGAIPSSLPTVFNEIEALCLNIEAGNKLGVVFKRNNINNARTILPEPGDTISSYSFTLALEQALRENPGLLLKDNIFQKAVLEAQKSFSEFLPHVRADLGAAGSDNEAEASVYNRTLNRKFYTDIVIDQRLFSYPAIKAIHIAQKRRAMEKANQKQAVRDLKHAVTIGYLSVLENLDRVAAYKRIVDRLRSYWEMAITDHRLGRKDAIDVALMEEHLVQAKIQLFNARNKLKISRVILNVLLNRPGNDNLVLDRNEFSPENMVNLARKFEVYTSDAKKQKKLERFLAEVGIVNSIEMENAGLSIGIHRDLLSRSGKRYLPELNLRAKYSYGNEFQPKISDRKASWTIGGIISLPIFSGAEKIYDRKILSVELDELLFRKDSLRFACWQDIIIKAESFATRTSTLPMNYFAKNLSVNILDSALIKYNRGVYSSVELITIEKNTSEREIDLIKDKYQFFMSYAELMNTVGVGYLPMNSDEAIVFYKKLDSYMEN